MISRWLLLVGSLTGAGLAGCAPRVDLEKLRTRMEARDPELAQLESLAGHWHTTGQMTSLALAEPIRCEGYNQVDWECDGNYLVERYSSDMGEMGRIAGMSLWTWDPRARVYLWWRFGSYGETGAGTARYDEAARVWKLRSHGRNHKTGDSGLGEGTVRRIDDDTLEWTWTHWDASGLVKTAEFSGTSRRTRADAQTPEPLAP